MIQRNAILEKKSYLSYIQGIMLYSREGLNRVGSME